MQKPTRPGCGARTNIRGRPATRAVCYRPKPQCFERREACPQAAPYRPWQIVDADLSGYFDSIPHPVSLIITNGGEPTIHPKSPGPSEAHLLGLTRAVISFPGNASQMCTESKGRTLVKTADVVIIGSGSLAHGIVYALSQIAGSFRVAIIGRSSAKVSRMAHIANARAASFAHARFSSLSRFLNSMRQPSLEL